MDYSPNPSSPAVGNGLPSTTSTATKTKTSKSNHNTESVSPAVSRAVSPVTARNQTKGTGSSSLSAAKKKSTNSTSALSTSTPSAKADAKGSSAPTTPAISGGPFGSRAASEMSKSESAQDSKSSNKKGEVGLGKPKLEEGELEAEEEVVPISMEGVRVINVDDPSVIRLRGHTTPVRLSFLLPALRR